MGVFSGRIPYVWMSNNFSKTGVQMSTYSVNQPKGLEMLLDPNNQLANANKLKASTGNQEINVFQNDFRFAQTVKFNLGFDFKALDID